MIGIVVITLTSLILSVVISVVYQYINRYSQDIKNVELLLPGYNCNACGFGTCQNMAEKAFIDSYNIVRCRFLKEDRINEIKEYIKNIK